MRGTEPPRYGCSILFYIVYWGRILFYLPAEDTMSTAEGPTSVDVDIRGLNVKELKAKCKERGLGGYSQLNKAGLISLLKGTCVGGSTFTVVLVVLIPAWSSGLMAAVR